MSPRPLDCEVIRGSAPQDEFQMQADPEDYATLQAALRSWLEGHGWDRGHWPRFEMRVRHAGENKIRKTVRP